MTTNVRGCDLPDDLFYFIEKHVWARPEPDGTVRVGMTDVAQHMAKSIVSARMKSPGRQLQRGQSAGTIESAKFVGPVPSPVAGELIEVNPDVSAKPALVNDDPYGGGWLFRVRPVDWEADKATLASGPDGIEAYRKALEAAGIECV